MSMQPRETWPFPRPSFRNIKPDRPWTGHKAAKADIMTDELDSFGLEDSGLFFLTLKQNNIPFVGK